VSYNKQKLFTLREHLDSLQVFGWARVAHIFSFLCYAFLLLFLFVLYLVYPMLPVSLDCPFLIAPSGFSNVYLLMSIYSYTYPYEHEYVIKSSH